MKKAIGIIVTLLLFGGSICAIILGINYKNAIDSMYTSEQVEQIKQDTWQEALEKEQEYLKQIETLTKLVDDNNILIDQLKANITELENKDLNNQNTISELNETISLLNSQNQGYIEEIEELDMQINDLEEEIAILNSNTGQNDLVIQNLTKQLNTITTERDQLLQTKEQNLETIATLNILIDNLNNEIEDLEDSKLALEQQIQTLTNTVNGYLQEIANYQEIIEDLKEINTSVVTFEVDGQVINTQQVKKTESPTEVEDPSSEDFIFNGWMIKGTSEIIDPFTYSIMDDTVFVANITKYFSVTFEVNGANVSTQRILSGQSATDVEVDNTEDYVFNGWFVNGEVVENVENYVITAETKFVANLSYYKTVTFKDGQETLNSVKVLEGNKITSTPQVDSVEHYYTFKGWSLNNEIIDLSIYTVTTDVVLMAEKQYENVAVKYYSDDLPVNDYYLYDQSDITAFANFVNNEHEDFVGKTILLGNDIDLQNYNFNPIGTQKYPFSGDFDGQGYKIKNLNINSSNDYVGFFGYIDGTYKTYLGNVIFENVNIKGNNSVGAFAGFSSLFTENVHVSGQISGNSRVGGIVGRSSGILRKVSNNASVNGLNSVGGLVGYVSTGSSSGFAIIDSYNSGNITATGVNCGGLTGFVLNRGVSSSAVSYVRCYNSGVISGTNFVAGIQGFGDGQQHFYLSFNVGTISGNEYVSGISNSNTTRNLDVLLSLYDCYSIGAINGTIVDPLVATTVNTVNLKDCEFNNSDQNKHGAIKNDALALSNFKDKSFALFTEDEYSNTQILQVIGQKITSWDFEDVWFTNGADLPVLR